MLLYIFNSIFEHPQSLGGISHQKIFDDRLGLSVHILRKSYFALQNILIDNHGVFVSEGVDSSIHFIN